MKKDSFIFYRSFYEAIKELPRDIQGEIYTAIMEYSLNGNEIENLKPIAKSLFILMKPQIDKNLQRYENGKKGGRPKKDETEQKPNKNQDETEQKPNVNDNVNANVNDNGFNSIEGKKEFSPPPLDSQNLDLEDSGPNIETGKRKKVPLKKESIKQRAERFNDDIWALAKGTDYATKRDELRKFWEYWSEHGARDRKMRFEKETSFSIERRLKTWFDNVEKFKRNGNTEHKQPNHESVGRTRKTIDYSERF